MGDVTVRDSAGRAYSIPQERVQEVLSGGGFHVETGTEEADRVAAENRSDVYGGAVGKFAALGLGALGTATGGLSDVALRAAGGGDVERAIREENPISSGIGSVAGAFIPAGLGGLAGKAGSAVAEGLGGGILARAAGGAAEGAVFGAGSGVSELALSQDPLTAEHIASALSSNLLLGGAAGGLAGAANAGIERGLQRAGRAMQEATAARTTLEGMPEDLANLDDAGLVAARKEAATAHAADIESEKASLEQLRAERRVEMANEVRDLHNDLMTERPIFHAVQGDDVAEIAGVKDIKVQMAKSFKSMRAAFDSPIGAARDPSTLLRPLEQRQAALEALQDKIPELQAKLAGDPRADVLAHVDDVLGETKTQIQAIQALKTTPSNPVTSARLTALTSGPSDRMLAIDAARDALKKAPELGLVGKAATGAAFAGGTALAHMIPGVGIAAPFVGKAASDAVGSLFTRMAGGARAAAAGMDGAAQKFLGTATGAIEAVGKAAPAAAALTAKEVLSRVRFGPEQPGAPEQQGKATRGTELADLFTKRSAELRQQTMMAPDGSIQMRPEARQAITRQLAPIAAVNPILADKVETVKARTIAYQSSKIPKRPDIGGLQVGPDNWHPSDLQIRSFARTVRACEDPAGVERRLADGTITPEDAEAYRTCYPERFAALQQRIFMAAPTLSKTLPTSKKVALFTFTGVPTMPALQPNVFKVLQGIYAAEPGTAGGTAAPKPIPAFGALGSPRAAESPTPAQKRGG